MPHGFSSTIRLPIVASAWIATMTSLYLLASLFIGALMGISDPNELPIASEATLISAIATLQALMILSLVVLYRHRTFEAPARTGWTVVLVFCTVVAVPCFLLLTAYGTPDTRRKGLGWFALVFMFVVLVSLLVAVFSVYRTAERVSNARVTAKPPFYAILPVTRIPAIRRC